MELPIFAGCLGGVPKQARFLTGRVGEELCYLDPHYVLPAVDRINLSQEIDTFRCSDFRLMDQEQMDPSVGVCLHLKSPRDLQVLTHAVERVRKKLYSSVRSIRKTVSLAMNAILQANSRCWRSLSLNLSLPVGWNKTSKTCSSRSAISTPVTALSPPFFLNEWFIYYQLITE